MRISKIPNISAMAWELLKKRHALVCVPDNASAYALMEALQVFEPQSAKFFCPALETDLIKNRGPSLFRRVERMRFLHHFFQKDPGFYFVTAEALLQKTSSPEFWQTHPLHLKTGQEIDREILLEGLRNLGYLPSELVEQPFQYATRGSILDVYTPLDDKPVRLELFEDRIESIRSFHPDSQRCIDQKESICLVAAYEFLYNEATAPEALSKVRRLTQDLEWPRDQRSAFISRFEQLIHFPTLPFWISYFDSAAQPLYKLCKPDTVIDTLLVETQLRKNSRETEKQFVQALADGEWVPPADSFVESNFQESLHFLSDTLQLTCSVEVQTTLSQLQSLDPWVFEINKAKVDAKSFPFDFFVSSLKEKIASGYRVGFFSGSISQIERLSFLCEPYGLKCHSVENFLEFKNATPGLYGIPHDLEMGFEDPASALLFIHEDLIFSENRRKQNKSRYTREKNSALAGMDWNFDLLDLKPGDLIIQREHGIGKYLGLKSLRLEGAVSEFAELEYKDGSKLLLPISRLDTIQKYAGQEGAVALDKLGGSTWETKKKRARGDVQKIAAELLHLYSQRELAKTDPIIVSNEKTVAFANSFAFVETPDQEKAIQAVLEDLSKSRSMDRLVCGDVGYGKTEVAIRAAFAAASAGRQVAVLVPTTLLCIQHEANFKKRLEPFHIKVESISRLKSAKENSAVLDRVTEGITQVVIGTHRLLSKDVLFKDLGLLVVDEEQRFGVVHKEKIKQLRHNVHVLTLTATPIPRTLNMAMSGLKEFSAIMTPPKDRLSIRTHVAKKKASLIQEAVENEIQRGGQVFYVHNRIQKQPQIIQELKGLFPKYTIDFAHGQMTPDELEDKMLRFYKGDTQILLATAIIESGLDVPNANTIIVDRADMFGLSQLYQIRGRVGRSTNRAYAYFLIPDNLQITKDAEERLSVLEAYQELGSGFHIASHDLEIRGAGDFLGPEQSGHIRDIGYETYMQLLHEAIAELRGEHLEQPVSPEIRLGEESAIPDAYLSDANLRLVFYKKFATALTESEVEEVEKEMEDRFGTPPTPVKNLTFLHRIRCSLARLGVRSFTAGKNGFTLVFDPRTPIDTQKLVESVRRYPNHFQLLPDGKLLLRRAEGQDIGKGIEAALSQIEAWCGVGLDRQK